MTPSAEERKEVLEALQNLAIATTRLTNSLCWSRSLRRKFEGIQAMVIAAREELQAL